MTYSRQNIKEKTEKFTITFTWEQLKKLKEMAKKQNRTVAFFVREAVDDYINRFSDDENTPF